eukprot:GHRQ01033340.1.p1 GENE.GHRQ01033340.1~~GHRQ01033340.1.p1  ORF type:complete len:187 (-),score=11.76 GHRQ01033340.1:140-700(-)
MPARPNNHLLTSCSAPRNRTTHTHVHTLVHSVIHASTLEETSPAHEPPVEIQCPLLSGCFLLPNSVAAAVVRHCAVQRVPRLVTGVLHQAEVHAREVCCLQGDVTELVAYVGAYNGERVGCAGEMRAAAAVSEQGAEQEGKGSTGTAGAEVRACAAVAAITRLVCLNRYCGLPCAALRLLCTAQGQ